MPPPAVSVVIPVYNVEKYLQKCLDSVLAQTLKDIEIVCVNDGSTDDSRNILAEYVKKDNRIKVIDQLNQGQSVARNTGTAVATGKYIYFLDSDDWLEPDAMQSCFEIAEKNQLDEIIFDCITEYENEDLHSAFHFKNKGTVPSGKAMPGEELFSRQVEAQEHMSCVWLRFLNRDFYLRSNLSFEPGIIHEDELFCVCCDVSAKRALFLSKRLYHYRLRKNSTVTAPPTLFRFHSMVTVLEHSCMFVQDHPQQNKDVKIAIARKQANWLHTVYKIANQLPAEQLQKESKQDSYRNWLYLYSNFIGGALIGSYRDGIRDERKKITCSLTYRIGRIFTAIPLWFRQKIHSGEK